MEIGLFSCEDMANRLAPFGKFNEFQGFFDHVAFTFEGCRLLTTLA
jgi:hypothetical protein